MKIKIVMLLCAVLVILQTRMYAQVRNIVLVHGAFADGSGFGKLYTLLEARGYNVSVVANPTTGMEDDVAATNRVLDRQDGPVILVGHSYAGAIITIAGNSSKVAGLVYIAAFAPDEGESMEKLLSEYPVDSLNGGLPPKDGFIWYDPAKYHAGFCADLPKSEADFMYASQVPVSASAFSYVFKDIAWKKKPSWHIVATEDHSLPPDLERFMGRRAGGKISEIKSSHVVFISHPEEVADIIAKAAHESLAK